MNIGQLEYLVATVEAGSYAKASERLYVTPQAISKSIGELERELGIKLIEGNPRGVAPSPAGFELAVRAESVLRSFSDLKACIHERHAEGEGTGRMRIAVSGVGLRGSVFGASILEGWQAKHPRANISLVHMPNETCLAALLAGGVDAAVLIGNPIDEHVIATRIGSLPVLLAYHADTPLAAAEGAAVRFVDLAGIRIAEPLDFAFCYLALAKHLRMAGAFSGFESVGATLRETKQFLREGGAIFVHANSPLPHLIPNVVLAPIEKAEGFSLPLYFATACSSQPATAPLIERHLSTQLAQRRR